MMVPLIPFNIEPLLCCETTLDQWHYNLCDPFWRLYVMDGQGWFVRFREEETALEPGRIYIIPARTPCFSGSRRRATQLYIHFTVSSPAQRYAPGIYSFALRGEAKGLVGRLRSSEDAFTNTLTVKELCYLGLRALPAQSLMKVQCSDRVNAAMEAMAGKMNEPLSNRELAQRAGMNTNAFIRLFHAETGQAPQKWYAEKRTDQAALLLSHSEKTIEEIADATGFCDRAHFSRAFAAARGMGPAAYRRQCLRQWRPAHKA